MDLVGYWVLKDETRAILMWHMNNQCSILESLSWRDKRIVLWTLNRQAKIFLCIIHAMNSLILYHTWNSWQNLVSYMKLLADTHKMNTKIIIKISLIVNKNCILLDYFFKFCCIAWLMHMEVSSPSCVTLTFIANSLAHKNCKVIYTRLMSKKSIGKTRKLEQSSIITNIITFTSIPAIWTFLFGYNGPNLSQLGMAWDKFFKMLLTTLAAEKWWIL